MTAHIRSTSDREMSCELQGLGATLFGGSSLRRYVEGSPKLFSPPFAYAACRRPSIWLTQSAIRFQLVKLWVTCSACVNSKLPRIAIPNSQSSPTAERSRRERPVASST
jgi:hypothetical protein